MDFTIGGVVFKSKRTGGIYIFFSGKKIVSVEFTCLIFNPKIDYLKTVDFTIAPIFSVNSPGKKFSLCKHRQKRKSGII